jgi:hypothetical protein
MKIVMGRRVYESAEQDSGARFVRKKNGRPNKCESLYVCPEKLAHF